MSEYEHNEHLLDEIQRLRESNFQLRQGAEEQKQRIKRLEEAGDAILNATSDYEQYKAMKQWRKVKEAKL